MTFAGYNQFSSNKSRVKKTHLDGGARFQSARAALRCFLEIKKVRSIWVPHYLCESVLSVLEELNVEAKQYELGPDLLPDQNFELKNGEHVLLVNYFGILGEGIDQYLSTRCLEDKERVIIDNSQALFEQPVRGVAATVYSPRKFLGIPDGGVLCTRSAFNYRLNKSYPGHRYLEHLYLREEGQSLAGYEAYLIAEAALNNTEPMSMSSFSSYVLDSVDLERTRMEREENFNRLHSHLGELNEVVFNKGANKSALCYPLLLSKSVEGVVEMLHKEDIFVPRYWPNTISHIWYQNCLFLPIDQRLCTRDIDLIVKKVLSFVESSL